MTRGWLWFVLSLGLALMLAAAQQLVPAAHTFWLWTFAAGLSLVLAGLAAYLIGGER